MAYTLSRYLTISILATASFNCFAGGFQLMEQSASSLGNAFAGNSAIVDDASIVFFNPAGTTFLNNPQIAVVGSVINTNSDVEFTSSTINGALPIGGNNREDAGGWFALPTGYFALPVHCWCNDFAVGLGVTSPYGLETNYTTSAMDRYLGTHSRVTTINIGPTLAWRPAPYFSIGAGFDAQYIDANLRSQVFSGNPALADRSIENTGDGWGYGWNVGALFSSVQSGTSVGLAYRSRVDHSLNGDVDLFVPALGTTIEGGLRADVKLPDFATLSVTQDIDCWTLIASASWIHWNLVDTVTLNYSGALAQTGLTSAALALAYEDSWRYAAAVNYRPSPCWKLRAGVMYDETPVKNADTNTFRLPDNDRIWVALGANYKINSMFNVDAGYSHLFINRFNVNQSAVLGGAVFNTQADVKSSANIFAMQLNVNFC